MFSSTEAGSKRTFQDWSPSFRASFTPVAVTVWLAFQLAWVKVRDDGDTVPSVVSVLVTAMVTLPAGRVRSRTGSVAVPPSSVGVPTTSPTASWGSTANTGMAPVVRSLPSFVTQSLQKKASCWSVVNVPV